MPQMAFGVWPSLSTQTERPFLVAGDKSGVSEKRFYHQLIDLADERFEAHAAKVKKRKEKQKKELR